MKIIQLTDKSWILKSNDITVGTLFRQDEQFLFMSPEKKAYYNTFEDFTSDYGIKKILNSDDASVIPSHIKLENINGYPVKHDGFKIVDGVNPPRYTKGSTLSKSEFCAGYWIVKNNNTYCQKLCPKYSTINENESIGPFKTKIEMLQKFNTLLKEIKMMGA